VTRGRHSLASRNARVRRLTLLTAPLVTCAVVGVGIALAGSGTAPAPSSQVAGKAPTSHDRVVALSRSAERQGPPVLPMLPMVTARRWLTAAVDLRLSPAADASTDGEFKRLRRIGVTGLTHNGFAQVVVGSHTYWITGKYLVATKPTNPADLPLADVPCPGTSGVESGLKPGAVRVYRAVCNAFPQITSYGGYAARGEHSSGKAIDIMTSDVALGTEIADFLRAHAAELDLFDVIWRQHIWTPVRASEGWRPMPDRGSETANHDNHVHVSVN
jgi:hypothetical protein